MNVLVIVKIFVKKLAVNYLGNNCKGTG